MKSISPSELICMNDYTGRAPIRIDMVYADAAHPENIFKTALYRHDARLFLYEDLAHIVLAVAYMAQAQRGAFLVLKDGLRTIEAQAAMQVTAIVKANPQWSAPGPDRLLSPPGMGGHPRGMAVDVTLADESGTEWDMGTAFDYLTPDPQHNPAARGYTDLPPHVLENRVYLEKLFWQAAAEQGQEILALPSEWWDFRFPNSFTQQFAALSDEDLPADMRMCQTR